MPGGDKTALIDLLLAYLTAAARGSNVVDARPQTAIGGRPSWLDMGLANRINAGPPPSSYHMPAGSPDQITQDLLRAFTADPGGRRSLGPWWMQ